MLLITSPLLLKNQCCYTYRHMNTRSKSKTTKQSKQQRSQNSKILQHRETKMEKKKKRGMLQVVVVGGGGVVGGGKVVRGREGVRGVVRGGSGMIQIMT